jgi:hypothetical protein
MSHFLLAAFIATLVYSGLLWATYGLIRWQYGGYLRIAITGLYLGSIFLLAAIFREGLQ